MGKFLTIDDPVLPLQHPRVLVETALAQGANLAALLRDTGIREDQLRDPSARVSYAAFGMLAFNALRATNNRALGLDFGARIQLTNLGIVGLAVLSSDTLEEALRTQLRLGPIYLPSWEGTLSTTRTQARLTLESVLPFGPLRAFATEALVASLVQALGPDVPMHELRFDYPAPDYAASYAQLGAAPVKFDQAAIEIVFDVRALANKLPTADPLTHASALLVCQAELAKLPRRQRLVHRVKQLLNEAGHAYPDPESVARALELSPRSLRRALKDEGTSYQKLLEEARRERALQHLSTQHASFEVAAEQLGFSDVRSLRRSVRRWTGLSLQQLRARTEAERSR